MRLIRRRVEHARSEAALTAVLTVMLPLVVLLLSTALANHRYLMLMRDVREQRDYF
jgi:hypothetical protein